MVSTAFRNLMPCTGCKEVTTHDPPILDSLNAKEALIERFKQDFSLHALISSLELVTYLPHEKV